MKKAKKKKPVPFTVVPPPVEEVGIKNIGNPSQHFDFVKNGCWRRLAEHEFYGSKRRNEYDD